MIPPRIQRIRMRLMRYQYRVLYVPGKLLATADTLSRTPVDAPENRRVDAVVCRGCLELGGGLEYTTSPRYPQTSVEDETGAALIRYCKEGWPKANSPLPINLREYWRDHPSISVSQGLLLKDQRLIIPKSFRKEMLLRLHEGHQGINRCRARARDSVWWPTLNGELEQLILGCAECASTRVQRSEPMISTLTPSRPWQRVGIDLFELKRRNYILIVDYYSRFPEVVSLSSTSPLSAIAATKSCFARFGIPNVVVSENGPQFSFKRFATFASGYGFQYATSSPKYPQANGEAERMVRTLKDLFSKSGDPHMALMVYRDIPGLTGYSPSQLLFGRRLQTKAPKLHEALTPEWPSHTKVQRKDEAARTRQRKDFNPQARCL